MKSTLPLLTLVVALSSCTTAYKSAQTPDDVYFSPARPRVETDEYVQRQDQQDRYNYDDQSADDRYLRMKVQNRRLWSDLDYYYSDPYAYNYNPYNNYYGLSYNTPWNYYSSWNYYYNPYSYFNPYGTYYSYNPYFFSPSYGYGYGSHVVIGNTRPPVVNRPRTFNLNTYNPAAQSNTSYGRSSRRVFGGDNNRYYYNNSNNSSYYHSGNNSGSNLRGFFNNNNSSGSFSPSRSSVSAPTSSPSRGGGGSSNAGVRRF